MEKVSSRHGGIVKMDREWYRFRLNQIEDVSLYARCRREFWVGRVKALLIPLDGMEISGNQRDVRTPV
jgi:hypothetical protein